MSKSEQHTVVKAEEQGMNKSDGQMKNIYLNETTLQDISSNTNKKSST